MIRVGWNRHDAAFLPERCCCLCDDPFRPTDTKVEMYDPDGPDGGVCHTQCGLDRNWSCVPPDTEGS